MEKIRTLFNSFSKAEIKYLKAYLRAFHSKGDNKALDFILMLEKKPDLSKAVASRKLYGDVQSKGFIMMKSRLYEKMLETLSLSVNLSNAHPDQFSNVLLETIKIRKQLVSGLILRKRGEYELAQDLFSKCKKQAEILNLPDIELQALIPLRTLEARSEHKHFGEMDDRINYLLDNYRSDIQSFSAWETYQHSYANSSSEAGIPERISYLEANIPPLEASFGNKDFIRANYYLQQLKSYYFNMTDDYKNCKEALLGVFEVIKKSEGMKDGSRLGLPLTQLGYLELRWFKFDEAIEVLDQAASHFSKKRPNYQRVLLLKIYILIHQGKLGEAKKELSKIERLTQPKRIDIVDAILNYHRACISFIQKDYANAWNMAQGFLDLPFDKSGWLAGMKIFEIMIVIELEDYDLASNKIENLRKHISKYKVTNRPEIIYRMLRGMENNSFERTGIKQEKDYLRVLEEDYPWAIAGHETIRFDKWYKARANKEDSGIHSAHLINESDTRPIARQTLTD